MMKTTSKMVWMALVALFSNVSSAEESIVPALKQLLNTRRMKDAESTGGVANVALARLLKNAMSPLQSVGVLLESRPNAPRLLEGRQLDTHPPVCNQTNYLGSDCNSR